MEVEVVKLGELDLASSVLGTVELKFAELKKIFGWKARPHQDQ